jgi:hypothetical protein
MAFEDRIVTIFRVNTKKYLVALDRQLYFSTYGTKLYRSYYFSLKTGSDPLSETSSSVCYSVFIAFINLKTPDDGRSPGSQ